MYRSDIFKGAVYVGCNQLWAEREYEKTSKADSHKSG